MGTSQNEILSESIPHLERKYNDYEYPKVSIIIPTHNCSQRVADTVDSILDQNYPDFEIIIIDASSTDRTLEVIKNYRDDRIIVYSASDFMRYEMLNKGITQSKGQYLNFLFPGDFYVHKNATLHMMELALDHDKPHMLYCGTLLRDGRHEAKILYRSLSQENLRRGMQPTSIQSCWFHQDTFKKIGKFNRSLRLRGGFEMMCRFLQHEELNIVETKRVLTDYDLRLVTREMVYYHFKETMGIIFRYFGLLATLRWLLIQKDIGRFFKMWMRNLKVAFFGRQ